MLFWLLEFLGHIADLFELTVFSVHAPLQWLYRMKTSNQRLLKLSLILQESNFFITHIAGKANIVADALSRCQ